MVGSLVIVGLFAALGYLFKSVPTSFIPNEDKGFFMVDVQLPQSASLNRTGVAVDEMNELLMADPTITSDPTNRLLARKRTSTT